MTRADWEQSPDRPANWEKFRGLRVAIDPMPGPAVVLDTAQLVAVLSRPRRRRFQFWK